MEITATLPAISAIGCFFVAWTAILYYCEKLYIAAALRYGITDKSSGGTIASGGGIIFPLAYIASEFFSLLTQGAFQYPLFLIGAVIIASVSFLDDAKPQSPVMRLAVHFACAALLVWQVCYTTGSAIPAWLIALLAIATVAIVNAFNFMDGIKGITGCYALSVILPLMAAGCPEHSELVLLALVPATAVFCTFNFRTPERCYCGDVGAIFLGYAAALFGCLLHANRIFANSAQFLLLPDSRFGPFIERYASAPSRSRYYDLLPFLREQPNVFYTFPAQCEDDKTQYEHIRELPNMHILRIRSKVHGDTLEGICWPYLLTMDNDRRTDLYRRYSRKPVYRLTASNAVLPTGEKVRLLCHKIAKKLRKLFCALHRRGTHHKGTHS